jgi:hypothetical protein
MIWHLVVKIPAYPQLDSLIYVRKETYMLDAVQTNLKFVFCICRFHGVVLLAVLLSGAVNGFSQTTAFSYQGTLSQGGVPANGTFQMTFSLWTAETGGNQVGATIGPQPVVVTNGNFAALLDFGAGAFPGDNRFLEITVGTTVLSPRPRMQSVPYAIRALTVTGPVSGSNASAVLTVTNAQPGITNPSPTNLPPAALKGEATSTSGSNVGVFGVGNGTDGVGVLGITNGSAGAGKGDPIGVIGIATSPTGETTGIVAQVVSPQGTAIEAQAGSGGFLIRGNSDEPSTGNPKFVVTAAGQVRANGAVFARGFQGNSGLFGVTDAGNMTVANIDTGSLTATANLTVNGVLTAPSVGSGMNIGGNLGVSGTVNIGSIPSGGTASLCVSTGGNVIRFCSSSLRYKQDVLPFTGGLTLVKQLRPISFKWKESGEDDLGLAAEEVGAADSRLVFLNTKGEIEGVRYSQINAVLINAIREQQEQIELQAAMIERQQKQLNKLARLVRRPGVQSGRKPR